MSVDNLWSQTLLHTKSHFFLTFADTPKTKVGCRLYFRGRMHCWWIFDFETDYILFIISAILIKIYVIPWRIYRVIHE
jgi:hypothetical protein